MQKKNNLPRILGVFAHPDDEIFCAGGTLAKYATAGAVTRVVSLTAGEAGQIRDANIATRRTLGEMRSAELQRSCTLLGVQEAICLDYGDGQLRDRDPETLIAQVIEQLRDFQPDVVITFGLDGAYGHPDHIVACEVTTVAVQHVAAEMSPRLLYAHFPRSSRLLLQLIVDWLSGLDLRFRGSVEFIQGLMLFADESTMLGYASDHLEVCWFPKGFYIIEQGEPAVSLYLILSGIVDIYVESADGVIELVEEHGHGTFIGETGLIYGKPRNAHVVAQENVTAMVLSPGTPTNFAGRGEGSQFAVDEGSPIADDNHGDATICIDVSTHVIKKVEALSQHRSQYPITRDMFPRPILERLLGKEYFVDATQKSLAHEL